MLKLDEKYNLRQTSTVVLLGLLIAFVLNIKGVYNWAKRLPHGEVRETFLTLLKPANRWYDASKIGVPKYLLADFFESQRKILKPKIVEPLPAEALPLVGPPRPQPKSLQPTVAKSVPKSILIMGDSMMVGALGKVLVNELQKTPHKPYRRAKISTGLARPDYFNWEQEVKDVYNGRKFSTAFVMLGGNDTQDIKSKGKTIYLGTRGWAKIYAQRVRRLANYMCERTPEVLWLGSPPMRSKIYNRKIQFVNQVLKSTLQKHRCAKYVPTGHLFSDKSGQYASYQKVFGQYRKVRMGDGIHLTRSGGHLLAQHLFRRFDILTGH